MNEDFKQDTLQEILLDACHPIACEEFISYTKASGYRKKISATFLRRYNIISNEGTSASTNTFLELLTEAKGLYSLHVDGRGFNLRILCCWKEEKWVLLHCFDKKSGNRKTDYSSHIPIAVKRRDEMLEGNNE